MDVTNGIRKKKLKWNKFLLSERNYFVNHKIEKRIIIFELKTNTEKVLPLYTFLERFNVFF